MEQDFFTRIWDLLLTPEVMSSLVGGGFTFLAASVTSVTGWLISRKFLHRKQAVRTCLWALREIQFYHRYEESMMKYTGRSKIALRKIVRDEHMAQSTNKFSHKLLEKKIETYEARVEDSLPD
ncbi:hypothetical protein [Vibrio crassostreae]|uniref:hypothetical protein n=1 Tax=Vibrio crassostreae TaxID=246167 RepID=UPI001B305DD9|nr:hypothetical protein [Vibrio crassostreae]